MAKSPSPSLSTSRIERWYNKIVIGFVVLTVILIALIAYFSFSKTTITVTSADLSQEITLEANASDLGGLVLVTDVESAVSVDQFDTFEEAEGRASGTVTIVNNYSQNQPLVETTRLLSEEGVLFRTQETVTVPAGGSVEVAVAADEEGADGDIGPSTFEIVALWDGLKEDIYATSEEPMTGGTVKSAVVSATDIANAQEEAESAIASVAIERFQEDIQTREELPDNPYLVEGAYVVEALSENANAEAGDTVSALEVSTTATVAGAVIDRESLSAYVKEQLDQIVAEGVQLGSDQTIQDVTVSVTSIAEDSTDAVLQIAFSVDMKLSPESEILDSKQLVNKSEGEVQTYLTAFDEITEVSVRFSPFWLKRTPALADNITLQVQ